MTIVSLADAPHAHCRITPFQVVSTQLDSFSRDFFQHNDDARLGSFFQVIPTMSPSPRQQLMPKTRQLPPPVL